MVASALYAFVEIMRLDSNNNNRLKSRRTVCTNLVVGTVCCPKAPALVRSMNPRSGQYRSCVEALSDARKRR